MSLKLMVDMSTDVKGSVEINESTGSKNYVISGNFSTPGKKNRNGRVYSREIWEDNVRKYQDEIKNNTNNTLMELEHPPRTQVDPWEAVAKIRKLEMRDGIVYGEAVILNNNDKKTNQIKALIEAGVKIGVSTRGTGRMKGDIVEEYNLITVDVVSNPSNYESSLEGFNESMILESVDITIDEKGKYICTPAGCSLVESESEELDERMRANINAVIYELKKLNDVQLAKVFSFILNLNENLDESVEPVIKEYFNVMKKLKKEVKSKKDIVIWTDFLRSMTNMSKVLEKIFEADWDKLYESTEPSECGCKAKAVVEALEKFSKKDEIEAREKEERELREKFESLFGKKISADINEAKVYKVSNKSFEDEKFQGWIEKDLGKPEGSEKNPELTIYNNKAGKPVFSYDNKRERFTILQNGLNLEDLQSYGLIIENEEK